MWFLRNIVWIVVLCLVFWFSYLNWEQQVSLLQLPGGLAFVNLNLVVAMFGAFVAGMLAALLASLVHVIRIRADQSRLERETKDLKRELSQLRNLPIEDLGLGESGEAR
ncbi:MAG TPA: LapA family protein [Candidatus Eisenbacteria bacterium]|nr:LapA family protein [Candidatus Eisenbacteria bacterium]